MILQNSPRRPSLLLSWLLVSQLLLALVGCETDKPIGPKGKPELVSLILEPTEVRLRVGHSIQAVVAGVYSDGTSSPLEGNLLWETENETVATVSTTGSIHALASGSTFITITELGTGLSAVSDLTVLGESEIEIVSVTIEPTVFECTEGGTQLLTLKGTYNDDSTGVLTTDVVWTTDAPTLATVSSAGFVNCVSGGETVIRAKHTSTELTSQVGVIINAQSPEPPPAVTLIRLELSPSSISLNTGVTQQLSAVGEYDDGSSQDISLQTSWYSSDESIATVNSSGLLTAVSAGTITITGTVDSIFGEASLTVQAIAAYVPQGSVASPIDVGSFQGSHVHISDSHQVDNTRSYYSFGIPVGAFYSIVVNSASDNVDLYTYANDSSFTTVECQSKQSGIVAELCGLLQSYGDRVYFAVDGGNTQEGSNYSIDIEIYETIKLDSLSASGITVSSTGTVQIYSIPSSASVVDISLTEMTGDFDLFTRQKSVDCLAATDGIVNENCTNMVVSDDTLYVGVISALAGDNTSATLKVQSASLEAEAVNIGQAPVFHFGEGNSQDNSGFSEYLVVVSPNTNYSVLLFDMSVDADIWGVYNADGGTLTCTGSVKQFGLDNEYCTVNSGENQFMIVRTWLWRDAGAFVVSVLETAN